MQMSFGALELAERLKRDNVLMKIDALIEWEELRPKLTGLYRRGVIAWWRTGTV